MNQLAVFPSNAVARWIDPEAERGATREHPPSLEPASETAHTENVGTRVDSQVSQLRYRPFERLASARGQSAILASAQGVAQASSIGRAR
jgi:uncharacterized protein (DUF2336 family)